LLTRIIARVDEAAACAIAFCAETVCVSSTLKDFSSPEKYRNFCADSAHFNLYLKQLLPLIPAANEFLLYVCEIVNANNTETTSTARSERERDRTHFCQNFGSGVISCSCELKKDEKMFD
jgi:hypothetical protein